MKATVPAMTGTRRIIRIMSDHVTEEINTFLYLSDGAGWQVPIDFSRPENLHNPGPRPGYKYIGFS